MGTNQDYKNRALTSLEGKWGTAVITTLIFMILSAGICWVVTTPMGNHLTMSYSTQGIWTLLCMPMAWGFVVYFLNLIRQDDIRIERLFDGYKDFVRIFLAKFCSELLIGIGLMALIVPGIILAAGFVMTDFILKDDPEIDALDAIKKSWQMTNGHKGALVGLFFSFLGWIILACLTLGIGFLLLYPYMQSALAHYYEDLKAEQGEQII